MSIYFLKVVALISMLLDHINEVFHLNIDIFTLIGRISFPLFAFSFAEGCHHTKHPGRRTVRLVIFTLLSEPCFNFALNINNWIRVVQRSEEITLFTFPRFRNVMTTLLISTLVIIAEKIYHSKIALKIAIFIAGMFLAEMLHSDYGAWGVFLVVGFYFFNSKKWNVVLTFIWCILFYLGYASWNGITFMWWGSHPSYFYIFQWFFSCISILLILLYNGKLGRKQGIGFYVFYPLHLLCLGIIREIIYFM